MTPRGPRLVGWWDAHQVGLFLAAIAVGAVAGLGLPHVAPAWELAITPALGALLFATFLAVPLGELGRSFRDLRFLAAVLVGNFVVVPAVAFGLSRFVVDDRGLLIGLLLVLLTPCVDYVVTFTGLAGGDRARMLAATPVLMGAQILLLPISLPLLAGDGATAAIEIGPFIQAFLGLIVLPLGAAAAVQLLARRRPVGRAIERGMAGAMIPLTVLVLVVVVASQIAAVGAQSPALLRLVPLYAAFGAIAVVLGIAAARIARLDVSGSRAVVFSLATRNSLVVLPLALALPASLGLAPLAVVTQTLVELLLLVVLVRVAPRLIPAADQPSG